VIRNFSRKFMDYGERKRQLPVLTDQESIQFFQSGEIMVIGPSELDASHLQFSHIIGINNIIEDTIPSDVSNRFVFCLQAL
jgi:hypothetical protein